VAIMPGLQTPHPTNQSPCAVEPHKCPMRDSENIEYQTHSEKFASNGSKIMQEAEKDTQRIHPWVAEGRQKARAGLSMLDAEGNWEKYLESIRLAERLGFDSFWIPDHPTFTSDFGTTLSALAVTTSTIRLGTLVNCIFYRNPVILARMAADIDRFSGGRFILGLGIGDFPPEFSQMGLPFLSTKERQQALEETIQAVKGLWGTEPFTYHGKYVQIEQCVLPLGPVQQPHVPLLIAGGGERVTLRQVAQYGDACNFGPHIWTGAVSTTEGVAHKFDVLRAHCETFKRPVDSILHTHLTIPLVLAETPAALDAKLAAIPPEAREMFRSGEVALTPPEAIEYYNELVRAGMQYFIVSVSPGDVETIQLFGQQVLPALTMGPAVETQSRAD
jgi:alkanesulfonate monooxygenase SsuD/methylene tetrahydromethanopterin reductase-like flavin-dependent oxidoreductase (luciferase family)